MRCDVYHGFLPAVPAAKVVTKCTAFIWTASVMKRRGDDDQPRISRHFAQALESTFQWCRSSFWETEDICVVSNPTIMC